MKTVAELSVEHNINRSTLLKAAQFGRVTAHQSGRTWLIDEESQKFQTWLAGCKTGKPRKTHRISTNSIEKAEHE